MKFVTVKFRQSGLHHWAGADNYLRHPHRHEFHFTVWLEVFHDDREVEFIALKEELQDYMHGVLGDPGHTYSYSCEMMADVVVLYLREQYPGRSVRVWVEEDGENGAYVEAE